MSLYEAVQKEIEEFKTSIHAVLADNKITLDELWPFIKAVYANLKDIYIAFVVEAEKNGGTGQAKKDLVLAAVQDLFDNVIKPIPKPGPDVFVNKILEEAIMIGAEWAIDLIVETLNSTGKMELVRKDANS